MSYSIIASRSIRVERPIDVPEETVDRYRKVQLVVAAALLTLGFVFLIVNAIGGIHGFSLDIAGRIGTFVIGLASLGGCAALFGDAAYKVDERMPVFCKLAYRTLDPLADTLSLQRQENGRYIERQAEERRQDERTPLLREQPVTGTPVLTGK